MQNFNLNPGGIIGGIVGAGIAAAAIFSLLDGVQNEGRAGRGPWKLIAFAAFGGAFAGNFLWGQIFSGMGSSRPAKKKSKKTATKKKRVYDRSD